MKLCCFTFYKLFDSFLKKEKEKEKKIINLKVKN